MRPHVQNKSRNEQRMAGKLKNHYPPNNHLDTAANIQLDLPLTNEQEHMLDMSLIRDLRKSRTTHGKANTLRLDWRSF